MVCPLLLQAAIHPIGTVIIMLEAAPQFLRGAVLPVVLDIPLQDLPVAAVSEDKIIKKSIGNDGFFLSVGN